eukprot:scaffold3074_cov60-Phaeocystis_antarctica.AAC.1
MARGGAKACGAGAAARRSGVGWFGGSATVHGATRAGGTAGVAVGVAVVIAVVIAKVIAAATKEAVTAVAGGSTVTVRTKGRGGGAFGEESAGKKPGKQRGRGGQTDQAVSQPEASRRRSRAPSNSPVIADSCGERGESCALPSDGSSQPLTLESIIA